VFNYLIVIYLTKILLVFHGVGKYMEWCKFDVVFIFSNGFKYVWLMYVTKIRINDNLIFYVMKAYLKELFM